MIINDDFCKYKGKIYECSPGIKESILRSCYYWDYAVNAFEKLPERVGNCKYFKRVPTSEINWFCIVYTIGYYKECRVYIDYEREGKYRIVRINVSNPKSEEYEVFTKENGFHMFDRYDWCGNVPKSEVHGIEQIVIRHHLFENKFPDRWDFQIPGDDDEFPRRFAIQADDWAAHKIAQGKIVDINRK